MSIKILTKYKEKCKIKKKLMNYQNKKRPMQSKGLYFFNKNLYDNYNVIH